VVMVRGGGDVGGGISGRRVDAARQFCFFRHFQRTNRTSATEWRVRCITMGPPDITEDAGGYADGMSRAQLSRRARG
jgi:hypothetical protein